MNIFGFDCEKSFEYENGFYLTSSQQRLQKIIAHYELYKKIIHLPGAIVELGVFKGSSFIRFATFRNMLEASSSRKIIGFDAFGDFPLPVSASQHDAAFINHFQSIAGTGISKDEMQKALDSKGIDNIELVAGDINHTLKKYLEMTPELRISMLHIDVDVYEPTKLALELLYPKIVNGGLIVLDDYGTVEGETRAVDEFIECTKLCIKKLPISHIPAYIEKEHRT